MSSSTWGVTWYRKTRVLWDSPHPVLVDPIESITRGGSEIHPSPASQNVQLLLSGGWIIEAHQEQPHYLNESGDPTNSILRSTGPVPRINTDPKVVETPAFRSPDDLPGVIGTGGLASAVVAGVALAKANIPAVSSYVATYHAPDMAAHPEVPLNPNIGMERWFVSTVQFDKDQPFYIRFEMPQSGMNTPDVLFSWHFSNEYVVYFLGDGTAKLFYFTPAGSTLAAFSTGSILIDQWRWSEPRQVMNNTHTFRIIPHHSPGKKHLHTNSGVNDNAPSNANRPNSWLAGATVTTGHYTDLASAIVPAILGGGLASLPTDVPKLANAARETFRAQPYAVPPGPVRLGVRSDLTPRIQAAIATYPTGILIDGPFAISPYSITGFGTRSEVTLSWQATTPTGTSLNGVLYDAVTGLPLTLLASGATTGNNWRRYRLVRGHSHYFAKFTFTPSSGLYPRSPILWRYTVSKPGYFELHDAGEWEAGDFRSLRATGGENDPRQVSGELVMNDPKGEMLKLNKRGRVPVKVISEFDPNPLLWSVYFQGRAEKNEAEKKGIPNPAGKLWPSSEYRSYQCHLIGEWARLERAQLPEKPYFVGLDPTAPPYPPGHELEGISVPMKVTDVIRLAFGWAGYTSDMIDVPDINIRFHVAPGEGKMAQFLPALGSIGEWIVTAALEWLNFWVTFDANAGANGKWRVLPHTTEPYTPLYAFSSAVPVGKLALHPGSYPAQTCWFERESLRTWVRAPEGNAVHVVGLEQIDRNRRGAIIDQWIRNPKAANFFTDSSGNTVITADSNHPDYTDGCMEPIVVVDAGLTTQESVNRVAKRVYDVACHGVKMCSFEAPLVLVSPAMTGDAQQVRWRPLRFYDPVSINGSIWLIRDVVIDYDRDAKQMATYECQALGNFGTIPDMP